jgi:hypothetical protein
MTMPVTVSDAEALLHHMSLAIMTVEVLALLQAAFQ